MSQTIKLNYGAVQPLLSSRMQSHPVMAKFINNILGYTNIGNYARAKVFKKHISRLPLQQIKKVVDLGCGYGEYSFMMAGALKHARLTALDIDQDALRNVRFAQRKLRLPNLDIYEGELKTLTENEYDLIYSVDVFEHIPEAQMPFADAKSKLKRDGYLMVKMPHVTQSSVFPSAWFKQHEEWLQHEHPGQVYSLQDLRNRFEDEGFRVIFASQTDGWCSRLAWETAYLMKQAGTVFQLLSLPFCKALVSLDTLITAKSSTRGNAITVIGQKL